VDNVAANEVSDPGAFEYTAPTVTSATSTGNQLLAVSASDGGSGLSTTARWPFVNGAYIQGVDEEDNHTQLIDYNASPNQTFSIPPVYVVVADNDHNRADPLQTGKRKSVIIVID
jgi:hypothetical protein